MEGGCVRLKEGKIRWCWRGRGGWGGEEEEEEGC